MKRLWSILAALVMVGAVLAVQPERPALADGNTVCPLPYTFVNGTTADANQMNSQLNTLAGCSIPVYNASGVQISTATYHAVLLTVALPASPTSCGPMSSWYCETITLTGAAAFTTPSSVVCAGTWTENNPDSLGSSYWGTYVVTVNSPHVDYFVTSTGSTIYAGDSISGGYGYNIWCVGY